MTCCCFRTNRCAIYLCLFEIVISLFVWYELAVLVSQTFTNIQLKDVLLLVFISAWLITLFTATSTLILANKRQNPEFLLPRLVLQAGLLIIGFLIALLILAYFSGGSATINKIIINVCEKLMLDKNLTTDERREAQDSLKYYFMVLILCDFFFIIYTSFGLCVTKRFHKELQNNRNSSINRRLSSNLPVSGDGYGRVPSDDFKPNAPPPPYNPNFDKKS